jgi:hypothetical protein
LLLQELYVCGTPEERLIRHSELSCDIRRTGSYERIPRRSDGHASMLEPF